MNGFALFPLLIFGFMVIMVLIVILPFFFQRKKPHAVKNKQEAVARLHSLLLAVRNKKTSVSQTEDKSVKHEHAVQRTRRDW